ncbi:hypothetical protein AMATHDRAFT_80138 [Amanita thiersii Skay4041]|uniref:UDP-galactose transporter n=1 Tax=Amanita thiersii Skay4041 TaxID=703135 RepID=A0A2A9NVK3_9AGAR|nr:hypothetical protein AMATHDRAFT_80138 [Amanita thiersii Skay4041]
MARPHPRVSALNLSLPNSPSRTSPSDMHYRPLPSARHPSSTTSSSTPSQSSSPRLSPLSPPSPFNYSEKSMALNTSALNGALQSLDTQSVPTICGMPLKYVSLVTLAVQNAALSIVMHYSRVSTPPALAYSPASAVLLNELLKGAISFVIALMRVRENADVQLQKRSLWGYLRSLPAPFWLIWGEVFSPDCWKLSIPAILYVIQNSLQFVAISNLPVATFQVTYQMKILTTAAFSVALLRKKLGGTKWLSLFFLAIGVGIVQIQSSSGHHAGTKNVSVGSAHDYHVHVMSPLKGFGAVTAACFTSGLAGVYFEMVLKNSKADLWVRNVQLSLFSLIPALIPVLCSPAPEDSRGVISDLFRNFGGWAWATVSIQVFGGLVTAIVIKYSDNIMKGFATSLSILLSFLASVILFDFRMTPSFCIGATTVLVATWMYNQPAPPKDVTIGGAPGDKDAPVFVLNNSNGKSTPFPGSPVASDAPILGHPSRKAKRFGASPGGENGNAIGNGFGETLDTQRYYEAPYGSPLPSRVPSRVPTPSPCTSPLLSDGRSSP